MAKPLVQLTALSEEQRAQAYARFELLRPALEGEISQTQTARTHHLAQKHGPAVGQPLSRTRFSWPATTRSDKGKSRRLPQEAISLVEGLALQTPARSAASIHRQVVSIAAEQGWKPPPYVFSISLGSGP